MTEANEHKVDRTGWKPGPWDHEPDKAVWKTKAGLPGMIVRNHNGALCGYVAVARGHELYGVDYSAGDYPDSLEGRISVHGGLTYAEKCRGSICHVPDAGEPEDVWWFGFDCNHADDYAPKDAKYEDEHPCFRRNHRDVYRDFSYVRSEVESLAAQIISLRTGSEE